MFRKLMTAAAVISVVLLPGGAALAGGWAVTEFDEPLSGFTAGEEYVIGFTVLQHGETPRWTESVHLTFKSFDGGPTIKFPAKPTGVEGHFEAVVVLRDAGVWQLEADQGFLSDFPLHLEPHVVGPVNVSPSAEAVLVAPPPPQVAASSVSTGSGFSTRVLLSLMSAAFGAGALLVWMTSSWGSPRHEKCIRRHRPAPRPPGRQRTNRGSPRKERPRFWRPGAGV